MTQCAPTVATSHAKLLGPRTALVGTLLVSLALALLATHGRVEEVWRTGAFFDTDDAMRAVQLRDLLAGQGWFDLVAHRLDPPNGQSMHWSRIVDVPLAGCNLFFSLFLTPEYAERATRLVFPVALLAALLAFAGWLGALLSGPAARLASIWLVMLSGPMFAQFIPGRIDHHAPQVVTLVAAFGFLLQGLDPRQAWRLSVAAALMALSMAISLENLPLFVPMVAAAPLLFIVDGAGARPQLLWFSAGALVALPAFYAATVPSAAYFHAACDAFSFVHLAAFLAGAVFLVLLALLSPALPTIRARIVSVGVAGAATLATFVLVAPNCFGDPLGGVDPLLRALWLSQVVEAMPLLAVARTAPDVATAVAAPVAMGLVAALYFARQSQGELRRRWLLVAAAIAVGVGAGMWQVRVFTSVTPIAMVPLAAAIVRVVERLDVTPALRVAVAAAVAFLLSPLGFAVALAPQGRAAAEGERACLTPQALAPLAELPPSRILASFNLGSHILAHTPHSVFAAPYHRNNHGNRIAADVFLAPPEEAGAIAREAGVDLVVWCARSDAPSSLVTSAPNGLAAMLARGEAPAWLERKSPNDAILLVFAVRRME